MFFFLPSLRKKKEKKTRGDNRKSKNKVKSDSASICLLLSFFSFGRIIIRETREREKERKSVKRRIWPSSAELLFLLRLFSRLLVFVVRSPWTRRPTLPRSSTPSTERFFFFCLNLIICHVSALYFQNEKIFTNLHLFRTNFFGSLTVDFGIGFRSWFISLPFVSLFGCWEKWREVRGLWNCGILWMIGVPIGFN